MATGTIKRLTDRGFGFIGVDGSTSEKDLFFHSNELKDVTFEELKEGDRVEFEIGSGPKGDNATNVMRADGAPAKSAGAAAAATDDEDEEEAKEAPAADEEEATGAAEDEEETEKK